jgi:dTDP-4-dehydrorhamnose 3,5-epimerase
MEIIKTDLKDVLILEPKIFGDSRGYFFESFRDDWFQKNVQKTSFVQDNESYSNKGVFRGMHYQVPPFCQSKLVRVVQGTVIDFVCDLRKDSPTFRRSIGIELSSENKRLLWIPRGFAHGFLVTSDTAIFQYKVDHFYSKDCERSFNPLDLNARLPIPNASEIVLSDKDKLSPTFDSCATFDSSVGLYES